MSNLFSIRIAMTVCFTGALFLGSGCELRQRMYDSARYEPLEASDFFGDRRSARPLIEGTVARGHLVEDTHLVEGKVDGELATEFPFEITQDVLDRGEERFNIYCSVCHGKAGYGNGLVVQRGFRQPTSYHIDRLRQAQPGYFFDVITRGFGVMPSYSYQVSPEDRWAIIAHIRALQISQNAAVSDLPEEAKLELSKSE